MTETWTASAPGANMALGVILINFEKKLYSLYYANLKMFIENL